MLWSLPGWLKLLSCHAPCPDDDRDLLQRKLCATGGSTAPVASPYADFLVKSEMSKSWFFSATADEQKLLTFAGLAKLEFSEGDVGVEGSERG